MKLKSQNRKNKIEILKTFLFWFGIFLIVMALSLLIAIAVNGVLAKVASGDYNFNDSGLALVIIIGLFFGIGLISMAGWTVLYFKTRKIKAMKKNKANSGNNKIVNKKTVLTTTSQLNRPVQQINRTVAQSTKPGYGVANTKTTTTKTVYSRTNSSQQPKQTSTTVTNSK